ncbi:uncharacterized protein LOC111358991 [Spodoptera litura]|uniref:Uncharacterized protein LOC111358991 n=1 Tax=Spodoptera litura TaxID=69820 RepID=A0A9J7EKG7_SPOLT|nr:uncharacterized protein LOC111358991 [Spodoptera litura]
MRAHLRSVYCSNPDIPGKYQPVTIQDARQILPSGLNDNVQSPLRLIAHLNVSVHGHVITDMYENTVIHIDERFVPYIRSILRRLLYRRSQFSGNAQGGDPKKVGTERISSKKMLYKTVFFNRFVVSVLKQMD